MKTFRVMRPFKYNGKMIERGEEWSPTGEIWDHKLMKNAKYLIEITPEKLALEDKSRQKLYDKRRKSLKGEAYPLYKSFDTHTAKALEENGFKTIEDVKKAKDEILLGISGIGQKRLDAIRAVA